MCPPSTPRTDVFDQVRLPNPWTNGSTRLAAQPCFPSLANLSEDGATRLDSSITTPFHHVRFCGYGTNVKGRMSSRRTISSPFSTLPLSSFSPLCLLLYNIKANRLLNSIHSCSLFLARKDPVVSVPATWLLLSLIDRPEFIHPFSHLRLLDTVSASWTDSRRSFFLSISLKVAKIPAWWPCRRQSRDPFPLIALDG